MGAKIQISLHYRILTVLQTRNIGPLWFQFKFIRFRQNASKIYDFEHCALQTSVVRFQHPKTSYATRQGQLQEWTEHSH
jgi:hypothetical protein